MASIDLGSSSTLSRRRVQCVSVDSQNFLLIFRDGRFHAMDHECPHKSASLCDAELSGRHLVCPWHGARFDIESGVSSGPLVLKNIKIWSVSIEQGRVNIHL